MTKTLTVTNGNTSGDGSWNYVVSQANGFGGIVEPIVINFSIGSGGIQSIPFSAQPVVITASNVTIDATTQPGYTLGVPSIVFDGTNVAQLAGDILLAFGAISWTGQNIIIKGLAVANWKCSGFRAGPNTRGWALETCRAGFLGDGLTAGPTLGHGLALNLGTVGRVGGLAKGTDCAFACSGTSSSGGLGDVTANNIGGANGLGLTVLRTKCGTSIDGLSIMVNPNVKGSVTNPDGTVTQNVVLGNSCPSSSLKLQAFANVEIGSLDPTLDLSAMPQFGGGLLYGVEMGHPDSKNFRMLRAAIGCDPAGLVAVPNTRSGNLLFNMSHGHVEQCKIKFNLRSGIGCDSSTPGNPALPYTGDDYTSKGFGRRHVLIGNDICDNGQSGIYDAQGQDHIIHDNLLAGNRDGYLTLGRTSMLASPTTDVDPNLPLKAPYILPARVDLYKNFVGVERDGVTPHGNTRHGLFLTNAYYHRVGDNQIYKGQNIIRFNGTVDPNTGAKSGYGLRIQGLGYNTHTLVPNGNVVTDNIQGQISATSS